MGTFHDLIVKNGEFKRLYDELGVSNEEEEDTEAGPADAAAPSLSIDDIEVVPENESKVDVPVAPSVNGKRKSMSSQSSKGQVASALTDAKKRDKKSLVVEAAKDAKSQEKKDIGKLVLAESITTGQVKWSVYTGYFRSVGVGASITLMLGIATSIGASMATSMWLSLWSQASLKGNAKSAGYYVGIYVALSVGQVLLTLVSSFAGYAGMNGF